MTKFYDQAFAPLNLTTSQFSLLSYINLLGPCNKSELAQQAGLDRTTIIRNLKLLEAKSLIKETPAASRSHNLVQLTEKGQEALKDGLARWKQAQHQVRQTIGAENLSVFRQIITDIESLDAEAQA